MGQRIRPNIPTVLDEDGDEDLSLDAAAIVLWWRDNQGWRQPIFSSSDWYGFSSEEFAEASNAVLWWREGAMACAGAYAGGEDDLMVEAAEWLYSANHRIYTIDREIDRLQNERKEIAWKLGK
jgi:hypothetical protein